MEIAKTIELLVFCACGSVCYANKALFRARQCFSFGSHETVEIMDNVTVNLQFVWGFLSGIAGTLVVQVTWLIWKAGR